MEDRVAERRFPKRVQIQTTVACGADCSICPHPVASPRWSNGPMDDGLFDRIVEELRGREIEYVAPYLMADPLADRRIFERMERLRDALPAATFEISTTGQFLTDKNIAKLLASPLNELRISSHGLTAAEYAQTMPGVNHQRGMANILRLIERWRAERPFELSIVCLWGLWPRDREAEIAAYWRGLGVALSQWRVISRAEQVDLTIFGAGSADPTLYALRKGPAPYRCRSCRDTEWLHILSDGRVTLCCMDYQQEVVLGDLRAATIAEIYNGAAFERARAAIRADVSADAAALCRRCEWHVSEQVALEQQRRNAAESETAVIGAGSR